MTDAAMPVRILVVDDDDVDREQIRRHLDRCGLPAQVTEAQDATAALALCRQGAFDCVLLDYRLPDANGLELVDAFAGEPTAVVMLTGLGNEAIAVEAMKRGVKDYLLKDTLGPNELRRAVVNALQKQQLEQEVRDKNKRLEEMSLTDTLTGLPNRNLFSDRLEQAVRSARRGNKRFAVFMMDLNLFKQINDNHGHEAGDALLHAVAARLREALRDSDTAARLGGDEFAALLPTTETPEGAASLAERVHRSVARPLSFNGHILEAGISIGIGLFPDHGADAKSLLHAADLAMYRAKTDGKSFFVCSGVEARRPADDGLPKRLEEGLCRAELVLHYQPKIELRTGRLVGAEALVRWNHPDLGLLPPVQFIPAAERTALIRPLTMKVVEMAAAQSALWRERGGALPVAVNLSPRLLSGKGLAEEIIDILSRHAVPPGDLTLDIAETGVMANAATADDCLRDLAARGIRLAIDDFGTGTMSLRHLRDLPLSELKIDPLLIRDLRAGSKDAAILRAIVDLSNDLGIAVVSEGIETHQAWRTLQALGCGLGQGYAIARPMPAQELDRFREGWKLSQSPGAEPAPSDPRCGPMRQDPTGPQAAAVEQPPRRAVRV